MSTDHLSKPLPSKLIWLWSNESHPNQTLLFRTLVKGLGRFDRVTLQIAANTRYFISVDNKYLGQGPCPASKKQSIVDNYKIKVTGDMTCISVIVHYYGVDSQSHSSAKPGMWCQLLGEDNQSETVLDLPVENWRYYKQGGWISTRCKRSWATGWAEQFDAHLHPANWHALDFDDSKWAVPIEIEYPGYSLAPRQVPALHEWSHPARKLIAAAEVPFEALFPTDGSVKLGKVMDEEPWQQLSATRLRMLQSTWQNNQGITTDSLTSGLALLFDLGQEVVGQTEFTIKAIDGYVDHCGAERLKGGRPWTYLKDADYASRWFPSGKMESYRSLNYNGFRYLLIVLRPRTKPMHLISAGAWRRQAAIRPTVEFQSDDPELQSLWKTSMHTIQVGTQETSIDCPTREQAFYIGDGLWHCLWVTHLFNEESYLHHFFEAAIESQDEDNGLVPAAIFRAIQPPVYFLDYCLIYVWGIDIYRRALPENSSKVIAALKSCERVLKWFERHIGPSGLLEVDPNTIGNKPSGEYEQIAFIDHPGIGWHMRNEPGLERSWKQQGLNAFLVIALNAFLATAKACDYTHQLDLDKLSLDRIQQQSHNLFFNVETGFYADCIDESGVKKGWSAHSQILAILAELVTGVEAHHLMTLLIESRNHPELCKCTPYFWIYFSEALHKSGHSDKIISLVKEAWHEMNINPEVTTWWECFTGDELDSYCHPWSAVPAWLLHPYGKRFRLC